MWRPEGWKNPFPIEAENNPDSAYAIGRRSFEAGADAMLERLKSQAHQDWLATPAGESAKGKWVFIPDEEARDAKITLH